MAKAIVKIELNYDLDNFYGSEVYNEVDERDILKDLQDLIYDDLIDLMRNDSVVSWAELEVGKD